MIKKINDRFYHHFKKQKGTYKTIAKTFKKNAKISVGEINNDSDKLFSFPVF